MRDYVPDWLERGLPTEHQPRCSYCHGKKAKLYDERLDVYYCDDSCLYHYCADNIDRIVHFHAQTHVTEL